MIEVRITWMGTKEGWLEIIQYKILGDCDFNLLKQWLGGTSGASIGQGWLDRIQHQIKIVMYCSWGL